MQRAHPFRLGVWRLGLLVLAWYALVLQALIGGQLSARVAFDPLGMAALCLDGAQARHDAPGAPLHPAGACECLVHCAAGAGAGAPLRAAAMPAFDARDFLPVSVPPRRDVFIPVIARVGAPVRGPPAFVALAS